MEMSMSDRHVNSSALEVSLVSCLQRTDDDCFIATSFFAHCFKSLIPYSPSILLLITILSGSLFLLFSLTLLQFHSFQCWLILPINWAVWNMLGWEEEIDDVVSGGFCFVMKDIECQTYILLLNVWREDWRFGEFRLLKFKIILLL